MYYRTPADLLARPVEEGREFRLGGLVETGSLTYGEGAEIRFLVTDGVESRAVRYVGPVPDLFREGQGVIADGTLIPGGDGVFQATRILAKHDENYVPRELRDLKETEASGYGSGAR
jgi:cytochrome c-type biogenesis protein CcmE